MHFTVPGYLCKENHEGSQAKQHCKYFYCSVYLEDLMNKHSIFHPT